MDIKKVTESVGEMWADTFKPTKSEELGKSEDYPFQVLAFLGEAKAQLSVARTIMSQSPMFVDEQNAYLQLKELQNTVNDLQYYIRSIAKNK